MGERLAVPSLSRPAATTRCAAAASMSATSTLPSTSAWTRSCGLTARKTSESSLAGLPHQCGLRVRVTVPAPLFTLRSRNGPEVAARVVRARSLKAAGELVTCFGYSGEKRERQSPYGLAKVTRTSVSVLPRSIRSIRS